MLKPVEMSKVTIIGPTSSLAATVESLHSLNIIHFTEAGLESDGIFSEGQPMEGASDFSSQLLRIRAAKQLLVPHRETSAVRYTEQDIDSSMKSVMDTVDEILTTYKEKQSLLDRIRYYEERRAELMPLSAFPVKLEHYRDLESVVAFVGNVSRPVDEEMLKITSRFELYSNDGGRFIALFVDRRFTSDVRTMLSLLEFKEFRVPELSGNSIDRIVEIEGQISELRKRIDGLDIRIATLSAKSSDLLNAAEETVSADVSKAEAPLHFSVTEREFVARGWVPSEDIERLTSALSAASGGKIFVDVEVVRPASEQKGPETSGNSPDDSPPVKLRNVSVSKPFELLVRLFSLPSYGEYDPTIVVAITFALFVGLMINDLGYGILMVVLGYILILYFRDSRDMKQLAYILIISGVAGAIFGYFVFGLAFGFPVSPRPLLNPSDFSVAEGLLLLCIVVGLLHMGIGYGFSLSECVAGREPRKALSSAGWIAVLLGFVTMLAGIGRHNQPIGKLIWHYLFFWVSGSSITFSMMAIPDYAVILVAAGLALLIATEGAFALLESISLLANVISYARLAAIAIAGAALAGAINTMLMPRSFSANPAMFIAGLFLLVVAQIFVFIMLTLSAGLQALRLNYIEFFIKFFKGGGRAYKPFGLSRKYTVER